MAMYSINLILIGMTSLFYKIMVLHQTEEKKRHIKKTLIGVITFQLVLILAFRDHSIGVDVDNYLLFFDYIQQTSLSTGLTYRFENGYILLNKLISLISTNEQVFLALIASCAMIPVGRFIFKYSHYPFLSFMLYIAFEYYSFTFSGLRQSIAYAILLSSYGFIQRRTFIPFLICIFCAALFHRSSLIFIFAYFLHSVQMKKPMVLLVVMMNGLFFICRVQIYTLVSSLFYSDYGVVESGAFNRLVFSTVIFLLCCLRYKQTLRMCNENKGLYNIVLFGCSLMIFASVGTNVMRIADYYYIYIILLIPEAIRSIQNYKVRILVKYGVVLLMLLLYAWFMSADGFGILPYQFFWSSV